MNKNTKKLTVVTGAALATVAVNAQNVHADAQVAAKSNATVRTKTARTSTAKR